MGWHHASLCGQSSKINGTGPFYSHVQGLAVNNTKMLNPLNSLTIPPKSSILNKFNQFHSSTVKGH